MLQMNLGVCFKIEYPNELYKFLVDLIRYDNGQINEIKINEFNELQLPEGFHHFRGN